MARGNGSIAAVECVGAKKTTVYKRGNSRRFDSVYDGDLTTTLYFTSRTSVNNTILTELETLSTQIRILNFSWTILRCIMSISRSDLDVTGSALAVTEIPAVGYIMQILAKSLLWGLRDV